MKDPAGQIISSLPSLTQSELATIKLAIEQLQEPVPSQGVDHTLIVFDALMKVLSIKMTFSDLQKTSVYKLWQRDAPGCLEFIEETFPPVKRSRVTKLGVLCFVLEILRDNLKAGRIPVTVGTMITHLSRVPQVFDKAFPGYRESGLTDLILQRMKKSHK